ncbi:Cullin binding-domain-containing protein [Armillaria borealis]|uniref:Defective in cullin neddylation protein n=1 Tax=Armillaria borealis TaxID=47425 RepID=A0AA39MMT9_9AGAR|nr:Cullin binding-domain-containing protein [Armillaria borealis]
MKLLPNSAVLREHKPKMPSGIWTNTSVSTRRWMLTLMTLSRVVAEDQPLRLVQITIDGTIKFCEDLAVNPEDVVLLSIAYELKSKRMGEWGRQGWLEGWRSLGSDNIPAMRASLPKLSQKLSSDPAYFRKVYNHTFDFGRSEGQRSLAMDSAQAFWALLLPHGLKGGALSHTTSTDEDDVDMDATSEEGWKDQYTQWWFEYLEAKGGKGISKDTWSMFLDFVRSIDAKFEKYDAEEAWPSTIDDFVEWARERLKSSA